MHNARGELIAYAGYRPKTRARQPTLVGESLYDEVFNLHRAITVGIHSPVMIVLGFFDVFHLFGLGFERVVGLIGNRLQGPQLYLLLHHFPPANRFVLLFDETDEGRTVREEVLKALSRFTMVHAPDFREEGRLVQSLTAEESRDYL